MSNDLWQTITPISVDASRWTTIDKTEWANVYRLGFQLPVFSFSTVQWLGASFIIYEFRYNVGTYFSIKFPTNKPTPTTFVLAVRWVEGDQIHRYKFWENHTELLHYPLYTGQKIGPEFVLEVWTVQNSTVVQLEAPLQLLSSILVLRTSCCDPGPSPLQFAGNGLLFDNFENPYIDEYGNQVLDSRGRPIKLTPLPLIFDQPFKGGNITVLGGNEGFIILTNEGQMIQL